MDAQPFHDPAAQLVAWHNRHPLALRITPGEVSGVGVVMLPFVTTGDAASARWTHFPELAWQRLRQLAKLPGALATAPALKAAFSEDFIAPISPRRAAGFALRHGLPERPGGADWPQREVAVDGDVPADKLQHLYLTTASVERGRQRSRVLMGSGAVPQIIGPRLWNKRRVAIAAGVLALAMVVPLAGWFVLSGSGGTPDVVSAAPAASAPQVAAPAASVAAPAAPLAASEATPADASASEAAPAASQAAPEAPHSAAAASSAISAKAASEVIERVAEISGGASKKHPNVPAPDPDPDPVPTELAQDNIAMPARQAFRPVLSAAERSEAIRQAKLLRATTTPPPAPTAPRVKVFALVTSLTGTRSASERRQRMMALSFAGGKMSGDLRSEIMQVDKGWRATLWPFDSKASAETARDMLEERGVYTEVVSF